jgi:hypothetical protein
VIGANLLKEILAMGHIVSRSTADRTAGDEQDSKCCKPLKKLALIENINI